jgi:hypothetical protein
MNTRPMTVNVASREERATWRLERIAAQKEATVSTVLGRRARSSLVLKLAKMFLRGLHLDRLAKASVMDLRLTEIDLICPALPLAFDGYTLLQLSDLHVGITSGLVERAAGLVRNLPVDVAVFTGDIQTAGWPDAARAVRLLDPLLDSVRARDGMIAVLGNHDSHDLPEHLEQRGVTVLINECAEIRRGGDTIHVNGTDDVRYFFTEAAVRILNARSSGFSIALVHSPELADIAAETGHALYLTGHTHGGQIVLPGGRAVFTATVKNARLASGAWRLGGMQGYTSRGIGTGSVTIRWNCPAEIVHIRLHRNQP